jgi:hypothetical protein
LPDPSTFTKVGIAGVDGNAVVIDHGNGLYSFYAHMQKGSIKAKVGSATSWVCLVTPATPPHRTCTSTS